MGLDPAERAPGGPDGTGFQISLSLYPYLCLCLSSSLCLSLFVYLYRYLCPSVSLYLYVSLAVTLCLCPLSICPLFLAQDPRKDSRPGPTRGPTQSPRDPGLLVLWTRRPTRSRPSSILQRPLLLRGGPERPVQRVPSSTPRPPPTVPSGPHRCGVSFGTLRAGLSTLNLDSPNRHQPRLLDPPKEYRRVALPPVAGGAPTPGPVSRREDEGRDRRPRDTLDP